ncbi:hypothetical protein HDV00_007803 [Rhizophlyctis rosea]|nr:hypothetical protein HDV00_007803 [Rhizophlyctis rosea]
MTTPAPEEINMPGGYKPYEVPETKPDSTATTTPLEALPTSDLMDPAEGAEEISAPLATANVSSSKTNTTNPREAISSPVEGASDLNQPEGETIPATNTRLIVLDTTTITTMTEIDEDELELDTQAAEALADQMASTSTTVQEPNREDINKESKPSPIKSAYAKAKGGMEKLARKVTGKKSSGNTKEDSTGSSREKGKAVEESVDAGQRSTAGTGNGGKIFNFGAPGGTVEKGYL